MGKASKAIRKEKIFNYQKKKRKKVDSQFPRKVVISISTFPEKTPSSRIAKPYFVPWNTDTFFTQ